MRRARQPTLLSPYGAAAAGLGATPGFPAALVELVRSTKPAPSSPGSSRSYHAAWPNPTATG
jgi:hypothetical protein